MNLKYNTYHAFENMGSYYLFDNESLISCIIDKRVYDALKYNDTSMLTEEELQMFDTFHKQNLFFIDEPQERYLFPKYNMVIISMVPVSENIIKEPSGVLVVNKPTGITSHDVVSIVRRLYGTKRVGHTGTLNSMASGVLVVLVGRQIVVDIFKCPLYCFVIVTFRSRFYNRCRVFT